MEKRILNKENLTIPNLISSFRIILIPFIAYYYLAGKTVVSVALVLFSGFTDLFDGMIARKFNQVTELGKMLDPLADKLTQSVIAVCLAIRTSEIRPVLLIFIIKEMAMLAGAGVLFRKKRKPCAAQWYGKVATTLFYVTVVVILFLQYRPLSANLQNGLTYGLLAVTAGFMIYALVRYIMIFVTVLNSDDPKYYYDWQEKRQQKKMNKETGA